MSLFGKIVKTAVNVGTLPLDVVKDIVTLGNCTEDKTYTEKKLELIKEEADDD